MRLLICTQKIDETDGYFGFFGAWVRELAKYVTEVHIVCLYQGIMSLPNNVTVHSLGKEGGVSHLKYLWRFYTYIWSLRKEYDAVLVHMNPEYVGLGGIFWRMTGKRVVLWYTHKRVDLKLRVATMLASAIATASLESFRLKSKKVRVLGHGIDTEHFLPRKEKRINDVFRIGTVGRVSPSKQLEKIITASALLKERGVILSLQIVGQPARASDVAYENSLRNQIQSLGLQSVVELAGPLPYSQIPDFYRSLDIFVNLSLTGSLDKAVLEAMSCNVPVLTSNEAFKKVLPPELFTSSDPKDLASKIQEIIISGKRYTLRDMIEREHSLPQLIKKIIGMLE